MTTEKNSAGTQLDLEQQLTQIDEKYIMKGYDEEENGYEPITSQLEIQIQQVNQMLDRYITLEKGSPWLSHELTIIDHSKEAGDKFYKTDWLTKEYWDEAQKMLHAARAEFNNLLIRLPETNADSIAERIKNRIYSIEKRLDEIKYLLPKIKLHGKHYLHSDEKKNVAIISETFETPIAPRPTQTTECKQYTTSHKKITDESKLHKLYPATFEYVLSYLSAGEVMATALINKDNTNKIVSPEKSGANILHNRFSKFEKNLKSLSEENRNTFIKQCRASEEYAAEALRMPEKYKLTLIEKMEISNNHPRLKKWIEEHISAIYRDDPMKLTASIRNGEDLILSFYKLLNKLILNTHPDVLYFFALSSENALRLVTQTCLDNNQAIFISSQWKKMVKKNYVSDITHVRQCTKSIDLKNPKNMLDNMRSNQISPYQVFLIYKLHDQESILKKYLNTKQWVEVFQRCKTKCALKNMLRSKLAKTLFHSQHLLQIAKENPLAIRYILDQKLFDSTENMYFKKLIKPKNQKILLEIVEILLKDNKQEGWQILLNNPLIAGALPAHFWRNHGLNQPNLVESIQKHTLLPAIEIPFLTTPDNKEIETITAADKSNFATTNSVRLRFLKRSDTSPVNIRQPHRENTTAVNTHPDVKEITTISALDEPNFVTRKALKLRFLRRPAESPVHIQQPSIKEEQITPPLKPINRDGGS